MKRKNYDGSEYIERPDLNKCPDCGCYFGGANCPLCGKPCPEEYKAGNRKPEEKPKPQKVKVISSHPWYHTWWFIAVIMFLSPLVGVILLATSARKTWVKILVSLLIISPYIIFFVISYGSILFAGLGNMNSVPVDTSLTRVEYVAACEDLDGEEYFRNCQEYAEDFVTLSVIVEERIVDSGPDSYGSGYNVYYFCSPVDGGDINILIRDCSQDSRRNYLVGDMITVFGEGAGEVTIYGEAYTPVSAPCVYAAYIDKQN